MIPYWGLLLSGLASMEPIQCKILVMDSFGAPIEDTVRIEVTSRDGQVMPVSRDAGARAWYSSLKIGAYRVTGTAQGFYPVNKNVVIGRRVPSCTVILSLVIAPIENTGEDIDSKGVLTLDLRGCRLSRSAFVRAVGVYSGESAIARIDDARQLVRIGPITYGRYVVLVVDQKDVVGQRTADVIASDGVVVMTCHNP